MLLHHMVQPVSLKHLPVWSSVLFFSLAKLISLDGSSRTLIPTMMMEMCENANANGPNGL